MFCTFDTIPVGLVWFGLGSIECRARNEPRGHGQALREAACAPPPSPRPPPFGVTPNLLS